MCIYIYIYIYTYLSLSIYIERESTHVCIYTYINVKYIRVIRDETPAASFLYLGPSPIVNRTSLESLSVYVYVMCVVFMLYIIIYMLSYAYGV